MRKRKKGRKLSLKRDQRRALLKSLLRALFLHEKIKTTEAKAKEIAPLVDKYITKAKSDLAKARSGTLHVRRYLAQTFEAELVKKIIEEIAPRYKERSGGYTRIIKLGQRRKDGARMAIIELLK